MKCAQYDFSEMSPGKLAIVWESCFLNVLFRPVEDFCIMHWLQKMQFKGSWLVEQKPAVIKLK